MTKSKAQNPNKCQSSKHKFQILDLWTLIFGFCLVFGFWILILPSSAFAKPPQGFHEGPYILINGGLFNYTADNNIHTGEKVGRDFEPTVGFNFGWNLTDWIAPELEVRYSTNKNNGNREHVVDVNLNAVYSFIIDEHFIPFIQGGPMAQFAAIPGDPGSNDRVIGYWGPGVSLGAGLMVMFLQYGYVGILGQYDFLHLPAKNQSIGGITTQITAGGWDPQFGASIQTGVHF